MGREFPGAAGYLNTASLGVPPQVAVDEMTAALRAWQLGAAEPTEYDRYVEQARSSFAVMVGVPPSQVAVGAQVSALVAMATTVLEPGSRVLVPESEFTSATFPFLVRHDLRLDVVSAPLERLAGAIEPGTDMVAFSLVQSADGRVADVAAIRSAAAEVGALTMVDATQAAGWLPYRAADFDISVAGAYKWLLSPRGTAFMTVRPQVLERVTPLYAGWYAGQDPWDTIYGLPLRLAADTSRLDLSPGWLAWIGTSAALRVLNEIGVEAIHEHDVRLANRVRASLGLPAGDSSVISVELAPDFDASRLAGLRTAFRAGRLRAGFHLYNTDEDVERLLEAIRD